MMTNLAGAYPPAPQTALAHKCAARSLDNLERYLDSPLHGPSVDAFGEARERLARLAGGDHVPLILDSGCGTGRSACALARRHPDCVVLGVDRSLARLSKQPVTADDAPSNALLVRAELATFWRLLLAQRSADQLTATRVVQHHLLYPNPYPKPARLNLRWHGHPSFPVLLSLGGSLEVRSNWRAYLQEFAAAATLVAERSRAGAGSSPAGPPPLRVEELRLASAEDALTAFEEKFHRQGERLWRLRLPARQS